jgi:hypothetical protein
MVSQFGELGRTSGMLKMPGPQVIQILIPAVTGRLVEHTPNERSKGERVDG